MENIREIIKIHVENLQNLYLWRKIYSPFLFVFVQIYNVTVRSKLTFSFCRTGGDKHRRNLTNPTEGASTLS